MFRLVLIVLGMHLSLLFGAQFEIVAELKEEPMHMGLTQLSDIDKLDNRGEIGALIIINCGLENVFFNNMAFKISQHDKRGSYWVVLKKRASYFVISKQGFADQHYNFPSPLEGRAVYKMTIDEKNKQPEETMVVITSNQNRAEVFLNSEYVGMIENRIFTGLVPLGEQVLELRKSGFKPTQVTHTVTVDNNRLEINLEHDIPSALSIITEPAGATVYINNILFGVTPKISFFNVGTYPLRIEKEGYVTLNDEITIMEKETQQSYTLIDNRATLTINTSELATIKMNGMKYEKVKQLKLPPSVVELEISHPKAVTINQTITLNPLENITLDLYSDVDHGSIIILTIPTSAKIELTSDIGEFYSAKGSKSFTDIPVGKYYLEVSQKGYKKHKERIWLKKDDTVEKRLVLDIETVRKKRKEQDYFNRLGFGLDVTRLSEVLDFDYYDKKSLETMLKGFVAYELATDINEKIVFGLDLKLNFESLMEEKESGSYIDALLKKNIYFLFLKPSIKYKISEYGLSLDPDSILEITGYSYFSVNLPISRVYYDAGRVFPEDYRALDVLLNLDYGFENMSRYISRESLWQQFKRGYNVSTGLKFDAVRDNSLGEPDWSNVNSVSKIEFATLSDFYSFNFNPYVIFDLDLITESKHHSSSVVVGLTLASDINKYINVGMDMSSDHATPAKGRKEIKHRIIKSWINIYTKKHFNLSFSYVYQRLEPSSDAKLEYYDYNLGVSYLFDF